MPRDFDPVAMMSEPPTEQQEAPAPGYIPHDVDLMEHAEEGFANGPLANTLSGLSHMVLSGQALFSNPKLGGVADLPLPDSEPLKMYSSQELKDNFGVHSAFPMDAQSASVAKKFQDMYQAGEDKRQQDFALETPGMSGRGAEIAAGITSGLADPISLLAFTGVGLPEMMAARAAALVGKDIWAARAFVGLASGVGRGLQGGSLMEAWEAAGRYLDGDQQKTWGELAQDTATNMVMGGAIEGLTHLIFPDPHAAIKDMVAQREIPDTKPLADAAKAGERNTQIIRESGTVGEQLLTNEARPAGGRVPEDVLLGLTKEMSELHAQMLHPVEYVSPAVSEGFQPLGEPAKSNLEPRTEPSLPKTLSKISPRYGEIIPKFESDVDRAIYTVGNKKTLSKAHAKIESWLTDNGFTQEQIAERYARIKAYLKDNSGYADPDNTLSVPSHALEDVAGVGSQEPLSENPLPLDNPPTVTTPRDEEHAGILTADEWRRRGNTEMASRVEQGGQEFRELLAKEIDRRAKAGEYQAPPEPETPEEKPVIPEKAETPEGGEPYPGGNVEGQLADAKARTDESVREIQKQIENLPEGEKEAAQQKLDNLLKEEQGKLDKIKQEKGFMETAFECIGKCFGD